VAGQRALRPAHTLRTQNAELFALTYGSLVAQLLKDYEDVAAVNRQLDLMCVSPRSPPHGLLVLTRVLAAHEGATTSAPA